MSAYDLYISAVSSTLGIAPDIKWAEIPFRREGKDCVFDVEGKTSDVRICQTLEARRSDSVAVPEQYRGMFHFCRKTVMSGGGLLLFEVADTAGALEYLCDAGLMGNNLRSRLERFLSLRPLYEPALRTGMGIILDVDGEKPLVYYSARLLNGYEAASEGFFLPIALNLELTSQCPLRCPQCYCHLMEGHHLPLDIAEKWLRMAGDVGCREVNLSGGETMCYPWIYEVVSIARENGLKPNVALSGYGITAQTLDKLIDAGVDGIYVSLNGPTEEINRRTRDGYWLIIKLLSLLRERSFENVWINWVVHDSNAHLLPEMLKLAEEYKVRGLAVMAFKPDSRHELPSIPSKEQLYKLRDDIRAYSGPVEIVIESCYSSLRALCGKSFAGNQNRGPFLGCGAGRDSFSVALDGRLTPCRHLDMYEEAESLYDWWQTSPNLNRLRKVTDCTREPCLSCGLRDNCRHCMAVNLKLNGELYRGDATCPLVGA